MSDKNTVDRHKLAIEYEKKLTSRERSFKEQLGDAMRAQLQALGSFAEKGVDTALLSDLRQGKTPSSSITKHLGSLLALTMSKERRDILYEYADRITEYPYSSSYTRRSFRARSAGEYTGLILQMINRLTSPYTLDVSLARILNRESEEDVQAFLDEFTWHGCGYCSWQVAYALDHRDAEVERAVTRLLTEDAGLGGITSELIGGILRSHRPEFHKMLCDLLVAARLQEGLRQSICEQADSGTREGFMTVLRCIEEHGLIRFSSVKRAFGTWTGILTNDPGSLSRIGDKMVTLLRTCLEDEVRRAECLRSEDAMEIHLALWSLGFGGVEDAVRAVEQIIDTGSTHQILVAGYFAANLESAHSEGKLAYRVLRAHGTDDRVLALWLPRLLPGVKWGMINSERFGYSLDSRLRVLTDRQAEEMFALLRERYEGFTGKSKTFSPCVFPWYEARLTRSDLAEALCSIAFLTGDETMIDACCPMIVQCDNRQFFLEALLKKPKSALQRATLIAAVADKESSTRLRAFEMVKGLALTTEEYRSLEDNLRFKNSEIRTHTIELLLRQKDIPLRECLTRLLGQDREECRLAALDMLVRLQETGEKKGVLEALCPTLFAYFSSGRITPKEAPLLEKLLPQTGKGAEGEALYTNDDCLSPLPFDESFVSCCLDAFGEVFPDSALPARVRGREKSAVPTLAERFRTLIGKERVSETAEQTLQDLSFLLSLIEAHRTESRTDAEGNAVLLGEVTERCHFRCLALYDDLWRTWMIERGITVPRLIRASVRLAAYAQTSKYTETCVSFIAEVFGDGFETSLDLPHASFLTCLLSHLLDLQSEEGKVQERMQLLAAAIGAWFVRCVAEDKVLIHAPGKQRLPASCEMAHLLSHNQLYLLYSKLSCSACGALDSRKVFPILFDVYDRCAAAITRLPKPPAPQKQTHYMGYRYFDDNTFYTFSLRDPRDDNSYHGKPVIRICDFLHAGAIGMISEATLYYYLTIPEWRSTAFETVSSIAAFYIERGRNVQARNRYGMLRRDRHVREFIGQTDRIEEEEERLLCFVCRVYDRLIGEAIDTELARGDSPAAYSDAIPSIKRIYGTEYFVRILTALDTDTIDRGAYQSYMAPMSRRSSLSYLLSICIPAEADSVKTLSDALAERAIPTRRLIEAALFSPEWIPMVGEYLGIASFTSVCYYFMAHMNETFDDQRLAIIARYTPLSGEELNLGAFDLNWFRQSYSSIGEREFKLIYDAAKYTADGARHARARKYADAALGNLEIEATEQEIAAKRNKDLLMAYALIPVRDEEDVCRRYLTIMRFRKESKQFGSQRATSEGKAADMAIKNLALSAGYSDSMQLILRMEARIMDESRALLEPCTVDGVTVRVTVDETGKASLAVTKNGKPLKSLPAAIKKNEQILAREELRKKLVEQYRRTRLIFEEAMEQQTVFRFGDLASLLAHPVASPMLNRLVFFSEDTDGYLRWDGLLDASGTLHPTSLDAEVRIAHPFTLHERGCWRAYQQNLYENQTVQPFRQVFRELYVKTEDELGTYHSLRYAGNQLQPAKTVSVLKGRRWVADPEEGIQKVYYSENIVARIMALADWFSPADIEAPTLEWVVFLDRRSGKELRIDDIPDVLFSEVMRDVDLAVSVAHVGGVDPEASHSTVEMRSAIFTFLLPMFGLNNVTLNGQHAVIKGSLADYSVHLGSGVVHQLGGTMIPVLPVHSQHRGKIFLPFVDDDPKTAEILTKVLMFARDGKIKDPTVLAMIRKSI